MTNYNKIIAGLKKISNKERAEIQQRFFKTGPGEYGEGDVFIGVKMPQQRLITKKFINTPVSDLERLLDSKVHEHRMIALLIGVLQFEKGNEKQQKQIYTFFIKNSKKINNWDLVDVTVPRVIGKYLLNNKSEKEILYKFSKSKNLWQKRIAIISTFAFIRNLDFQDTLKISKILLNDKHDLIHKAVGWMLREIGNRNRDVEEKFLKIHYKTMPRTTLRYAIEKFPEKLRKNYLHGKI